MYAADLVIEALDVARQTNRLLGQSGQMITTQQALRASFWKDHPELTLQTNKEQNKHPANTHAAWCGYVKINRRPPRIGRNPRSGESVSVPPRRVPHFKVGKSLRERIDQAAPK